MIEQKVISDLKNDMGGVGTLYISALNPKSTNYSKHSINDYLTLENIDLVENPDNLTPIQYCVDSSTHFANLMLLEETDYQILFESKDINSSYDVLYSLVKMNNDFFNEFRFSLTEFEKYKVVGTLNFRSYVGKLFLDVKKNGYFLSLKGRQAPEEVKEAKKGIQLLGGQIESTHDFTLANHDDFRSNIIIKKVKETPKKYPRMFSKIKKSPL